MQLSLFASSCHPLARHCVLAYYKGEHVERNATGQIYDSRKSGVGQLPRMNAPKPYEGNSRIAASSNTEVTIVWHLDQRNAIADSTQIPQLVIQLNPGRLAYLCMSIESPKVKVP